VRWGIRAVPKVGPLNSLAFREPPPEIEKMFMASFNATADNYRALLVNMDAGQPQLPNQNFDTGEPARMGKYEESRICARCVSPRTSFAYGVANRAMKCR
jgi:hypothetical protein